MRITIPTEKAVLITKLFLSSIAALISFAFSVIATNPIFSSSLKTFLIVVNLKLLYSCWVKVSGIPKFFELA